MNFDNAASKIVTIYDKTGNKVDEVILPEKIVTLPNKRGGFSESGFYYKGSGCIYRGHMINEPDMECKLISRTGLSYERFQVIYPNLVGMKGIFTFPHQPIFNDLEGGCGPKENQILKNIKCFELTSIEEIIDVIPAGIANHNIFVYKYKNVSGNVLCLGDLIEYVLTNDFNTAWDKNLISDIDCYKYVRDLADWFVSPLLKHKFGTTFAFLYSLYNSDITGYVLLVKKLVGYNNADRQFIVYFAALITEKFCPGIFRNAGIDIYLLTKEVFRKLICLLFEGKACCHLENEEKWAYVRNELESDVDITVEKSWNNIVKIIS